MWCHTLNPCPWEAETGRFEASWSIQSVPCQLREYKKILSQISFLKINYKQWAREVAGAWGGVRRGQP